MRIRSAPTKILTCAILSVLPLPLSPQGQPQAGSQPVRWQAQYTQVYSQPPAAASPLGPALQLQTGASVVTDPSLTLAGNQATIRLKSYGTVATVPAALQLSGNTTYIVEFQYRILSYGTSDLVLGIGLVPSGDSDTKHWIPAGNMVKSAASAGTFSGGALTGNAASYVLTIGANSGNSDVVINRITIFRQDPAISSGLPASWSSLENLPYPRLGKDFGGGITNWNVRPGMLPFQYSMDQIESRLAFNDVIAGLWLTEQTSSPADIRRVRQLNPNAVILPYRMSGELGSTQAPQYGDISLDYSFLQAVPDAWYVKDSHKNRIGEAGYEVLQFLNIYPPCPVVGGQTYLDFLLSFLHQKVFPSGVWDGVFLDNFFAEANIHIPNLSNPALLDFDVNGNGLSDETPASISEMTRAAVTGMMDGFRAENGDLQLVIGNAGAFPELSLAPYINGSLFECVSDQWGRPPQASTAAWRRVFDAYRVMQATSRGPRINLLEGCGDQTRRFNDDSYLTPTADDLRNHRLALGTTLLSDGFYGFDLHDNFTVPSWYDEYSVDERGNAVEDRSKKGYLGAALTDAVELTDGGSPIFQATVDSSGLPRGIQANPRGAVSVSNGALILENPVHTSTGTVGINTNPAILPLSPVSSYHATFDVMVLDTLDALLRFRVYGRSQLDGFVVPSIIVKGDHSTVNFPFTISTPDAWSIAITMTGGGKVAISNFRVLKGGAGPWRRDFENGLVLVNPFPQPHTFSAADVAGTLHRTGIKRINGTQAPDINNGQPATGDLTVGAFDAIILLADRIAVGIPSITAASTPGGFPDIAQNGWIEIRGADLAPPSAGPSGITWDKAPSFESGIMPSELGGVRVTVNGKPAFVYFVSPNQVNVLSPLDATTGPVQIVVTSGGVSSAPFVANLRTAAPSFPLVGSTNYVVATHADYSLIGPASLSSPGYAFTPARAGETIILYAFGLGLPATPLVNGASTQSGTLPALPQVQIGGTTAAVSFAGVISPGLYQLNITIPLNVASGDNKLTLMYSGQNSPAGDLITAQ